MNIYDAAKILGLSGEILPRTTKQAYLKLLKEYHPDVNPAGLDMCKMINAAYEVLQDYVGDISKDQAQPEYGTELNEALNAIYGLAGLEIEICGAWVWVTGNTRAHKDVLKGAGFRYSAKKKAWYYRPRGFRSYSRGKYSLEEIRATYGTSRPEFIQRKAIAG